MAIGTVSQYQLISLQLLEIFRKSLDGHSFLLSQGWTLHSIGTEIVTSVIVALCQAKEHE